MVRSERRREKPCTGEGPPALAKSGAIAGFAHCHAWDMGAEEARDRQATPILRVMGIGVREG